MCKVKITLKGYCKTRFGSSFKTFESFLLKRDGFLLFNKNLISLQEWISIYKYKNVFGLINEVSNTLSNTTSITRDKIVFLFIHLKREINNLKNHLDSLSSIQIVQLIHKDIEEHGKNDIEEIDDNNYEDFEEDIVSSFCGVALFSSSSFWSILEESISKRLNPCIDEINNKLALYLSPLYRRMFMSPDHIEFCRSIIEERYLNEHDNSNRSINDEISSRVPLKKYFEKTISNYIDFIVNSKETTKYESILTIDTAKEFWSNKQNQINFPNLFLLAQSILHIPSSSIGIERIFSHANTILSNRNTRSSPQYFSSRLFIRLTPK